MSDRDVLDRAFESLTRDLAHSPGPGAAAAVSTARKRRRTKVGAVALATLVVVGGGLTVPRLVFPEGGVAANGGSARFDTAALARATDGWIGEWETWEQYSPWGAGGYGASSCSYVASPAGDIAPEPASRGTSRFVSHSGATAVLVVSDYADTDTAVAAQAQSFPAADSCGTTTTYDVDGVQVRHDSMAPEAGLEDDMWLGDIVSVRIGNERAELQVANDTGVADGTTAEELAEALVAGLRDGWTQSGMEDVRPHAEDKGMLPEWSDVDLEGALAGWRSPTKRAATTAPNLLCLHDHLNDVTSATHSAGGSPWGLSYGITGYDDPTGGEADVEVVLDQLRACTSTEVTLETLPNGVHVATYDTGGPEPDNAIWLVANGDRAGMIAVERADRPLPAGVRQDVADALLEILHKPWE